MDAEGPADVRPPHHPPARLTAPPVSVIFNPASGKGRGARLVEPLLAALRAAGVSADHALTRQAGDEDRLATEALARGARTLVAVGGDGTWGNVANAILRSGQPARLAFVAGGTGCDFAKSLGVPATDLAACARIVGEGQERAVDVGRVEDKHFLNVVGFGFDIAVVEDSWTVRRLSGAAVYIYCALRQLWRYPGFAVEVAADGEELGRREMMMLIVSNGRIFGGGFHIAPGADVADGQLDYVAFANMPVRRRLPLMARLLRGTHAAAPETSTRRGRSFTLRFAEPPAYETDGEWNRARSATLTVECLPAALRVLVPAR